MKIEKLKPNKIKIKMDNEDLSRWGVSADAVAKNLPETREMFVSILKQAEQETGFCCDNSKLVIEAALNESGGDLTLFVTKVDSAEENELFNRISAIHKPGEIHKTTEIKPAIQKQSRALIEIESFEDVIKLCYAIAHYYGGTLYAYNDKYYMLVDALYTPKACEFGNLLERHAMHVIEEHGKQIMKNDAFLVIRNNFDCEL